jgi:hypothetical protein
MYTFRALVAIPKQQQKGSQIRTRTTEPMQRPQWVTEHEVRMALLDGQLAPVMFDKAIADVKAWARYQKSLEARQFRAKKALPNHKRYNHVMAFNGSR